MPPNTLKAAIPQTEKKCLNEIIGTKMARICFFKGRLIKESAPCGHTMNCTSASALLFLMGGFSLVYIHGFSIYLTPETHLLFLLTKADDSLFEQAQRVICLSSEVLQFESMTNNEMSELTMKEEKPS